MKIQTTTSHKRKIYLLQPWYHDKCKIPASSLLYIKFYLMDHGYTNVEYIDCSHFNRNLDKVIDILKLTEDPIIGVTAYTKERFTAYETIRRIKNDIPKCLLVVGGRHFGFLPHEALTALPEIDMVVRGEGEITFKEICDAVHNDNSDLGNILGITYRKGNKIVDNPDRPLEMNIDQFRKWDKDNMPKGYPLALPTKVDSDSYFNVSATRGCPFKCVF